MIAKPSDTSPAFKALLQDRALCTRAVTMLAELARSYGNNVPAREVFIRMLDEATSALDDHAKGYLVEQEQLRNAVSILDMEGRS